MEADNSTVFTQWSINKGVEIHNVAPLSLAGRGFGLVTTSKIKQQDRLLFVPENAMLKSDPQLRIGSLQAQLAMTIARSCSSEWKSTWPSSATLHASMPLFWSESLQAQLPESAMQLLEKQRVEFQKDVAAVSHLSGYTRSFHFKPAGSRPRFMVLCPFIDYMNHGPSGKGVLVSQTPKGYEVKADRDYEVGEEILATYGGHSNDKLLINYGFINTATPGNWPSDDDIRLDHLILPKLSPEHREALQSVGFLGGFALLPSTNEVCFKTQVAVRAIISTTEKWQHYVANGEDLGPDQDGKVNEWIQPQMIEYRDLARKTIAELDGMAVGENEAQAVELLKMRWWQIEHAVGAFLREMSLTP